MSSYQKAKNFYTSQKPDNPLVSCSLNLLDSGFQGVDRTYGKGSYNCQLFTAQQCANNWNNFCEIESDNTDVRYPDNVDGLGISQNLNAGEILIRDTAHMKYIVKMINGDKKDIPFNPIDINSAKLITWVSKNGLPTIPVYYVDPTTVDKDPVLIKLLAKPSIAPDILKGLYKTAKRKGNLNEYNDTLLGYWFNVNKNLLG